MLNAFCRVAPSERFSFLAILPAGVFLRAIVFSSRTCTGVQARFFDAFFTLYSLRLLRGRPYSWKCFQKKAPRT
jgi:hypothetical protein